MIYFTKSDTGKRVHLTIQSSPSLPFSRAGSAYVCLRSVFQKMGEKDKDPEPQKGIKDRLSVYQGLVSLSDDCDMHTNPHVK